jgi:Domain of unknown function (DUF5010)/DUF5010 C-terminal domain
MSQSIQARRPWKTSLLTAAAALLLTAPSEAQYLGVTCGWQYSAELSGPPTYPTHHNLSLYNPDPGNPNETWDNWADQLIQAGVDFVCPNLTGSTPNTNSPPSQMAPLLTYITNRGAASTLKFAIFDDNAASWCAQWNLANGRGYGYAEPFDISNPANWVYIYDYNYKIFYQTIPDANRFKINGRPLIIIWTGNQPAFVTNMQGNASQAINYVRQKCQADWGFNPYIILSGDFFTNDTTCNNPGVADGSEHWFTPPNTTYSLATFSGNGTKTGVAVASFGTGNPQQILPNHGQTFDTGLANTTGAGALVTLCEGFTDYEEDAAMWRVQNLDTSGNPVTYSSGGGGGNGTGYDYPNQRINLLRKHSRNPFPSKLKFEAEGCDSFGGANGGNGKTNYYRNGNIAIDTASDTGGGWYVGWMQPGEWLQWQGVPLNGTPHFQARVATPNSGMTAHLLIDGVAESSPFTLPNTGGWQTWQTFDFGPYGTYSDSYHTVEVVFDSGNVNFNWWQIASPTKYEAESLSVEQAMPASHVASDSNLSGGEGQQLDATASGNSLTLVVPNVAAGTYDVILGVKNYVSRGIWQLSACPAGNPPGSNIGSPYDQYAANPTYTQVDLGNWSPGSTSNKWFTFTITGKNSSSTGYSALIDYIILTPQ